MNIIFCTSSSTKSGGSRQALYLAEELTARGHNLTFFTPANSTLRTLSDAICWADLPDEKAHWRKAVEAAFPSDGSPAIFHAFHNKAVKKAAWWGLSWKRRGIFCVGHRGVVFRPGNPLPYWSPGIADFVVNSKACADVLRKIGTSSKRLHVIYNGIPDERTTPAIDAATMRKQMGISPDTLIVGTVAGNNPVKGADILLEAFAKALARSPEDDEHISPEGGPHVDATLVMVGCSEDQFGEQAQQLGLASKTRLIAHTENVADYLGMMDCFVLPSRSESMPNTLLEAIRMGLPSVATDVGGVSELLGDTGILVPAEDPCAMGNAIYTMLTDHNLRTTCAEKSISAAQQYSIANRADRIEAVYHNIFKRNGLAAN